MPPPYGPAVFPHTCVIKRVTGYTKVSGEATPIYSTTQSRCKFAKCSVSVRGAGHTAFFQDETHIILPRDVVVNDGDTIVGAMVGYTGSYRIKDIDPIPCTVGTPPGIDHYEGVLERAV